MANEVGITVTGKDVSASSTLEGVDRKARTAGDGVSRLATSTDELDTTAAGATSSLGALASGFELMGQTGGVEFLGQAALATDFFAGAGEGATLVLDRFGGTFKGLKEGVGNYIRDMRDANTKTGDFVKATAAGALAVGIFVGAAQAASAAFGDDLNPQIEELTFNLRTFAATGKSSGEATRLFGEDMEHLSYDLGTLGSGFWDKLGNGVAGFTESLTGLGKVADESLTHAKERLTALDSSLAQLVKENPELAKKAFDRLAESAYEAGISYDDLTKGFPQYTAAQSKATRESENATAATKSQFVALNQLEDQIRAQTDPMFALVDAQQELRDAQKNYTSAVKDHGPKSREAKDALLALTKASLNSGAAAANAAGTFTGKLTPAIRATLKAAGMTDDQISNLEGSFRGAKREGERFAKDYTADAYLRMHVSLGYQGSAKAFKAAGGPAGGLTVVGENGPELLKLPQGSQVYPSDNQAYGNNQPGEGMGGGALQIHIMGGADDRLMRAIVEQLRFSISRYGSGSAERYLGTSA